MVWVQHVQVVVKAQHQGQHEGCHGHGALGVRQK